MTERVDFYVLNSSGEKPRLMFACRLTEKAYSRDLKVVVLVDDAAATATLDELLWTFSDGSFVPHSIHQGNPALDAATPVQLTPELDLVESADLLVNLSGRMPARIERFARIAEIIDTDDGRRRLARERFKAYRDLKLPLETHQLADADA